MERARSNGGDVRAATLTHQAESGTRVFARDRPASLARIAFRNQAVDIASVVFVMMITSTSSCASFSSSALEGVRRWALRHFMASNDPAFEAKATDIIGLYLAPPAHAAVFCVDEKTAIQALDRLDPVLPLSPGRAERPGFEYFRHGTLSLYAALETRSGQVIGSTASRHTSQEFVRFLEEVVATQPSARKSTSSWTTSPPTNQARGSLPCRPSKRVAALHAHL